MHCQEPVEGQFFVFIFHTKVAQELYRLKAMKLSKLMYPTEYMHSTPWLLNCLYESVFINGSPNFDTRFKANSIRVSRIPKLYHFSRRVSCLSPCLYSCSHFKPKRLSNA